MNDPHNLTWYEDEAYRFSRVVSTKFGAELNDYELQSIRDAMYRAVISARLRAELVERRG